MRIETLTLLVSVLCFLLVSCVVQRSIWAEDYVEAYHEELKPQPVVENEELMKLLFNPIFERLKAAVKKEPETRKEWQDLYAATYSLAEVNNLLFSRNDEEYMLEEDWAVMSEISRRVATELGDAIKSKDYMDIQMAYMDVVNTCNICHERVNPEDPTKITEFGPSATEKKKKKSTKSTESETSETP